MGKGDINITHFHYAIPPGQATEVARFQLVGKVNGRMEVETTEIPETETKHENFYDANESKYSNVAHVKVKAVSGLI